MKHRSLALFLKRITLFSFLFVTGLCQAQTKIDPLLSDTTILDYDEIFSELDLLLDSLNKPRNFSLVNFSLGSGYFHYLDKEGNVTTKKKINYSPSIGFFWKNGFGLGASASLLNNEGSFSPYQYFITGSYDYLKEKKLITGLSFTRFLTKKNLPFYTSPLQNEVYGYLTLRKLWFKPSLTAAYGWGSRESYEQREEIIQGILLSRTGYTQVNTTERIRDFNLTASVRHDFYFLNTLFRNDYVRVTPQLSFTGGTQRFGFNQTANTYTTRFLTGRNVLANSQNSSLADNRQFQPLSFTGFLKTEYAKGGFFLQPQLICDYSIQATEKKVTTSLFVSAGYLF